MITKPRISVLMAIFNAAEYLKEAINSILAQTFSDFEFIIVNDGSTDSSAEIVKSFSDPRIKFIDNGGNKGLIFSLNRGIDLAKGEFIARMDADDISLPERFEKQVDLFDKNPEIGACSTWFEFFGEGRGIKKFPSGHEEIYLRFLLSVQVGHPNSMVRRELLNKFNIRYDINFLHSEDTNLWVNLLQHTRFANIPEILYRYRKHKDQVTQVQSKSVRGSFQRSVNIHFKNILGHLRIGQADDFELYPSSGIDEQYVDRFEDILKQIVIKNKFQTLFDESVLNSVLLQLWKNNIRQFKMPLRWKFLKLFRSDLFNFIDFPLINRIRFFIRIV